MNFIKNIGLPVLFCLLIVSCSKETVELKDNLLEANTKTENVSYKSDCRTGDLNRSIKEILKDENDTENHKINMIMYHYGEAVMKMTSDSELLCYMTDAMLTDEKNPGVSISTLVMQNKNFKVKLNELLENSISKNSIYPATETGIANLMKDSSWDSNAFLRDNFTYKSEQYEPSIYFIKSPKYCDASSKVNVLIGEEANECDDVVGWSNGKKIFMSEKEILASNDINIFVGVDEIESKKEFSPKHGLTNGVIGSNTRVLTGATDIEVVVDQFQIKSGHHYETSGTSELVGWCLQYWAGVTDTNAELTAWEDFNHRNVDRDDIDDSTLFSTDRDAIDMSLSDFNDGKLVFIGVFEKDWYTRPKRVFNPVFSSQFTDVWVKMKFSHEYYFKATDHLNSMFSSFNFQPTYTNNSCRFKLKIN